MSFWLSDLTPRSIIEPDKDGIENEEDDLDDDKQGDVEILPPGPVEEVGGVAPATATTLRRITLTLVGNLRHISHQECFVLNSRSELSA